MWFSMSYLHHTFLYIPHKCGGEKAWGITCPYASDGIIFQEMGDGAKLSELDSTREDCGGVLHVVSLYFVVLSFEHVVRLFFSFIVLLEIKSTENNDIR